MKVKAEGIINRSISDVWDVMGNQFTEVHLRSSNFNDSKSDGDKKFNGIEYSKRITTTDRGETIQELDEFDSYNYSLSYHTSKGLPEVAIAATAKWFLKKQDENTTQVVFEFMMEPKPFVNSEMAAKIEKGLSMSAQLFAKELKHFMETGKAHTRNTEININVVK